MGDNVLGHRVAALRTERGWTQNELAARAAISRVALSHIEAGMSVPGERTVVLLAGLLHVEPHELVEGTAYPVAKSERLPSTAPRYTELEHQLALLDLALAGCPNPAERWLPVLEELESSTFDRRERSTIAQARRRLEHSVTSASNRDDPAP
ncbi:MAG TPA: helix-turn-helix transcriptional regulator [Acidimicrobiales bacterium]|nr:helix-turn-helix transcriptional regulator [Acidimicrobiales bacterium]